MRIEVRGRGLAATEELRNYVGLRLMSMLDHRARHVDGVAVSVAEVRTPDGGIERRCRMLALLAASGEVRAEEADAGLYAAIDRAAERLAHGVALALARPTTAAAGFAEVRAGAVATPRSRGLTRTRPAAQKLERG